MKLRVWPAVLAAIAIAAIAFVLRFNALGGSLGGFDNDHFIYLVRTDAVLAGEQPLRDFVDAELRGAWPALTYEVSAWAQQIGGRTLLPEAYLTAGLIAVAHATVFLLALALSKQWSIALLAAAVAIAKMPKLYNYPKVLALVAGAWALRAVALKPSVMRLTLAAIATAVAVLFRHDLGAYVAAGVLGALVVRDIGRWQAAIRNVAIYMGLTTLCLVPSLIWIQTYGGVVQYVQNGAANVQVEQARTNLRLPSFDPAAPFALPNLELVTYYAFWAVPVVALAAIGALLLRRGVTSMPHDRGIAVGLLLMTLLANTSFLRANLAERFGDAAPAVVLLAAWVAGTAVMWRVTVMRRVVVLVPAVLLTIMLGASYVFSDIARELETTGLSDSWGATVRRYGAVRAQLSRMPPAVWTDANAQGTLAAARFLAECTAPSDRVLVIGPVHEILVFARRRFAAGQAMFKLSLYTSEEYQRRALARLQRESVPIVIAEAAEFGEFEALYPLIGAHVRENYREAGSIAVSDDRQLRVFVTASGLSAAFTDRCTDIWSRAVQWRLPDDRLYRRLPPQSVDLRHREIQQHSGA